MKCCSEHRCWLIIIIQIPRNTFSATMKLTIPLTFADIQWEGQIEFLSITMFYISKISPKSILGPVESQNFTLCQHLVILVLLTNWCLNKKGQHFSGNVLKFVFFNLRSLYLDSNITEISFYNIQVASHYWNQWKLSSLMPYNVTRPQCIKQRIVLQQYSWYYL